MTQGHGDDAYRYSDIRLNFSSNIFASADLSELKQHLCRSIHLVDNYPEPEARSLEAAIARRHGVDAECVLVTNGATDAIYLVAEWFASRREGGYVLPMPTTFSEYADASRLYGLAPAAAGAEGQAPAANRAAEGGALCWLCNPNNPTGTVSTPQELLHRARRYAYLVVDQSYEDYTLAPMLSHADAAASENIIQLHSLTKTYAVPGLRIGYIVAPPAVVAQLRSRLRPWAVNALAVEAGRWLMEHDTRAVADLPAYLAETARLRARLAALPGVAVGATATSFMLAHISHATAAELKDYLAVAHHILIRDASNFSGLTAHHFRVSTQTPAANDALVTAITDFIAQKTSVTTSATTSTTAV